VNNHAYALRYLKRGVKNQIDRETKKFAATRIAEDFCT